MMREKGMRVADPRFSTPDYLQHKCLDRITVSRNPYLGQNVWKQVD